ncbi:MAG TPA: c-type cytochrome, partial [Candidatus Wunengus sp. YC64]|uniref:c-type cytochrome n=1 Tax=Candidatus Wunengus sp. YC64 TaxID=3367700 RepID=UPI004027B967
FFGAVFSGLAGIIALTILSIHHDSHDIHIIHQREDAEKQTARAIKLASRGVPPQGGLAIFLNDPVALGEKIFKESCNGCHMVKGEGGETGADFTNFGSREWVSGLLKDPKGKKYFKESGAMPPVKQPDESLRDMAEFLLSQSGGLHNQSADRLERGKELVLKGNCVICHPIGDKDAKRVAPNLTGYLSEEWLKEFIKNPSDPKFYGTRNKMPGFDKLSERELDALVQYLISLSKDRILVSEKEEGNKKRKYVFGQTAPRAVTAFKNVGWTSS